MREEQTMMYVNYFSLKQEKFLKAWRKNKSSNLKILTTKIIFVKREAGIVQQESMHSKVCILDFLYLYCNLRT